jgi:hypothetical protein
MLGHQLSEIGMILGLGQFVWRQLILAPIEVACIAAADFGLPVRLLDDRTVSGGWIEIGHDAPRGLLSAHYTFECGKRSCVAVPHLKRLLADKAVHRHGHRRYRT